MNQGVFVNQTIKEILEHYKTIWALGHFLRLGSWDQNTYLPDNGAEARGEAEGKLVVLSQQYFLDKNFVALIKKAATEPELNDYEKAVVRVLEKELRQYEKLPAEFLERWSKVISLSRVAWKNAKLNNDFPSFVPHLEKVVQLCQEKAERLGYQSHPYDALLDDYEEGWLTSEAESYFESLKQPLKELFEKIKSSANFLSKHPLEEAPYDEAEMRRVNQQILEFLLADKNSIRLDVSPHPFTESLSLRDVRITTWYHPKDFKRSVTALIHEFGHALYDFQCAVELEYTPIAGGRSMSLHESQSRFWENLVGRSFEFISKFYPDFSRLGPEIAKYSPEELWRYFNLARPGLIRVEADELSYHLHIMLRFELEKALIEGKIKARELPEIWREKMREYLGVVPETDTEGVLQDVHWSEGLFGYFPTYSLGSALSAVWKDLLEKELGEMGGVIKSGGEVKKIQDWLREKIHQYGSTYTLKDLLRRIIGGERVNPEFLLSYLKTKYSSLYSL